MWDDTVQLCNLLLLWGFEWSWLSPNWVNQSLSAFQSGAGVQSKKALFMRRAFKVWRHLGHGHCFGNFGTTFPELLCWGILIPNRTGSCCFSFCSNIRLWLILEKNCIRHSHSISAIFAVFQELRTRRKRLERVCPGTPTPSAFLTSGPALTSTNTHSHPQPRQKQIAVLVAQRPCSHELDSCHGVMPCMLSIRNSDWSVRGH